MDDHNRVLELIGEVGRAAAGADGPEQALNEIVKCYFGFLGDRTAHERDGALRPGERQYYVAGAFLVTPDAGYHMLVGNVGFPPDQQRLLVPVDAGHPGHVFATRRELLLENTDDHGEFRQYLKTSRMGSAIFAPMIWKGAFLGQIVMAAQARYTMRRCDLDVLKALANIAAANWIAHAGPAWLASAYPPANGFYADRRGVESVK